MAVNPDPSTLFLPDDTAIPSFLSDKFVPLTTGLIGLGSVLALRAISKRPLLSGIQTHLLVGLGAAGLGKLAKDQYDGYNMEKDAIYRHYIELHPEDFPPPERIRIGNLFKPWHPVR